MVDELDGLKEAGKQRARWRASHTLGLLDETLAGSTFGILRWAELVSQGGEVRGEVNMEIVLDPPGHVRLPIPDDEIIERAVAIQPLAARDVRLLTCDTGQHTRGRASGLKVTKVPASSPAPAVAAAPRPIPRPSCPRDTADHVPGDQPHSQTGEQHNHTSVQPS
ncbi:hypothetical protein [Streptomyces sp. NPDC003710]